MRLVDFWERVSAEEAAHREIEKDDPCNHMIAVEVELPDLCPACGYHEHSGGACTACGS